MFNIYWTGKNKQTNPDFKEPRIYQKDLKMNDDRIFHLLKKYWL